MQWVVIALFAWSALSYVGGVGQKPAPSSFQPAASIEDCHCYIEPNKGLYGKAN